MSDYPYTTVPGKLSTLLKKIREVGVPTKANQQWLQSLGFTSSNDRTMLGILKFIGFMDESGVPSSRWREYRGANHKQVLANAVRECAGSAGIGHSPIFLSDCGRSQPLVELRVFKA